MFQLLEARQTGKGTVIKFGGVQTLRTSRQYPFLVGYVDPNPRRWNRATDTYVNDPPRVRIVKGTSNHATAERAYRDTARFHKFILAFQGNDIVEIVQSS
jgi:hypothetical protein